MGAIDKMYLKNWEDYIEFKKWCEAQLPLVDKYGNKEHITEYLCKYDKPFTQWTPVFIAPYYVDAYVIRNCPLEEMQKELKRHYQTSYDDIKSGKLYASPRTDIDYVPGRHAKMLYWPGKKYNRPIKGQLWVEVDLPNYIENFMWFNERTKTWDFVDEYVVFDTYTNVAFVGTIKALIRKIRDWRLPVGTIVRANGYYISEHWEFVVKL